MQPSLREIPELSRTEIKIGNYSKFGKLIVLNISTTKQEDSVANNKARVLATLDSSVRPKETVVVTPVVGRDENYAPIPNCYIILRKTGDLEFYQASGATKTVKQILGIVSYFIK